MEDMNKEDNVMDELTGRICQIKRELIAKDGNLIKIKRELEKNNKVAAQNIYLCDMHGLWITDCDTGYKELLQSDRCIEKVSENYGNKKSGYYYVKTNWTNICQGT